MIPKTGHYPKRNEPSTSVMPASFFARLFLYWEAQVSLGLLVIQQALVGLSIYLSVEVSRKIAESNADPSDLFLLVGVSIAPFFPELPPTI